ncbi:MAG TPA: flagellar basal body-associated FliL family protein [Polyangia bacterium]
MSEDKELEVASETSLAKKGGGGGGGKILPLLLIINTLLIGAVLFFLIKKPAAAPAAPPKGGEHAEAAEGEGHEGGEAGAEGEGAAGEEGAAEGPDGKKKGHKKPGPILKLENFVIQLKTVDQDRYVRVAFDVEVGGEEDKAVLVEHMSHIRDLVIAYFADRTLDELRGSEAMERTKATLIKKIDDLVPGRRIKNLFITDFIIQ